MRHLRSRLPYKGPLGFPDHVTRFSMLIGGNRFVYTRSTWSGIARPLCSQREMANLRPVEVGIRSEVNLDSNKNIPNKLISFLEAYDISICFKQTCRINNATAGSLLQTWYNFEDIVTFRDLACAPLLFGYQ